MSLTFSIKEYSSIHVNQSNRELILIVLDEEKKMKVALIKNITGYIE
jgi:hypothetical protein